jgi:hypothetical protein
MFALCVAWDAALAGLRGLGFRMCAWCAPVEGDRHIFPLGFFGWGWVGFRRVDSLWRENEPVPGDHRGWASIGARMFALCVPWVAVMAGSRGLGFSDVRLLRPGGGGQAHFPAGFFRLGAGGLGWMLV